MIAVRATSLSSTRKIGEVFGVREETTLGPLTGEPMHEIVEWPEHLRETESGRTQYIFVRFCERVEDVTY